MAISLSMAFGASAQVNQEQLKKKAGEKETEGKRNLKAKSNSTLDPREQAEEDDDGANVGAIVGGVAAAAIVGTVVAKKKGGDDKTTETTVSFGAMDRNKNGALSLDEFKSAMSKAFASGDKDGDGLLTREEAVGAYGDRGGNYFDALDTEKSGSIAMSALDQDADQAFQWADGDADGSITAAEKTAAASDNAEAEKQQRANPGKKAKLVRKIR